MRYAWILIVFLMGGVCNAATFDWKTLHEKADTVSVQEARRAVARNPELLQDLYVLGLTYLNAYDHVEAEKVFRKMLEIDISSIPAQWGVAECLRRKKKCAMCIRLLEEIIAADPLFSPAYVSLAYVRYVKMDFNEAARLTYTVIKQGKETVDLTNFVRAHGLFAGAKGMIAHYGGPISKIINGRVVLPYLKKAEQLQPDSPVVLFGLGSYYLLTPPIFGRDLEKAEDYLTRAVEADPLFADIYVRLAQVYKMKGDRERYQKFIDKAIELEPDNEVALDIKNGTCKFICLQKED